MKAGRIAIGMGASLAALVVVLSAGCGSGSAERREARDRYLRRASAAQEAQDIDRAIRLCQQALARRPSLALAHRELGLMLDNYRQDYAAALYHYSRYLELRPDSPNRADVENLIRHCRVSLAAQVLESPDELRRDLQVRNERIAALELEVAGLREQLAMPRPAAPEPLAPPAAAVPPPPAPPRVHVVQAGETLATISVRHFGTPARWQDIFNANRDKLSNANNVRVGTALAIPPE
ncbi:MAG TPA: LysM peptidoglycan-binding domain-containing protein [Kiritimatiellia bacterium]|nr:LysM peptidoglycan-binding domain-containing protein [Lentisphaerota bacterium]HOU20875.1 LysM peptidoglycan-binding domain-containing protein [Kiritimatiellia bacterium]HPC18894.1 LysM peptidoglycan-binding domain-containing protein [Kiritimatiellia bacterium]HQQ60466.1 LysM peptidoglycan-binding domain-containing protein [Kiritimatiellia bacterium]